MEGGGDDRSLPNRDRAALPVGQHLDVVADGVDQRRADEHGRKRRVETDDVEGRLEAVGLPAEGVAVDGHIEDVERLDPVVVGVAGGDDEPRTGRQHGFARRHVGADLRVDSRLGQQPRDGRRLPAGHEQDVAVGDEAGLADGHDLAVEAVGGGRTVDRGGVFTHVSLDGDDAGVHT